jgi:hypothetical protein
MNTLSILAMAMIIYLFGGYVDATEAHPTYGQNAAARIARKFASFAAQLWTATGKIN